MDVPTVRQHLRELNERMTQLQEEEGVVRNLIVGYEGWLRLHGANGHAATARPPEIVATTKARPKSPEKPIPTVRPSSRPKGKESLNRTVLRIVQEAHGQPLHTSEILARAQAKGARTAAKKPERVIDLLLYSHRNRARAPVERVGPLTWRWIGE
jgi:hypothetical protein